MKKFLELQNSQDSSWERPTSIRNDKDFYSLTFKDGTIVEITSALVNQQLFDTIATNLFKARNKEKLKIKYQTHVGDFADPSVREKNTFTFLKAQMLGNAEEAQEVAGVGIWVDACHTIYETAAAAGTPVDTVAFPDRP